MEIKQALTEMDAFDDDQWTAEGLPKLDYLSGQVGEKVTRAEIMGIAPHFTRANMEIPGQEEEANAEEEGLREGSEEVTSTNLEKYLSEEPMEPRVFATFMQGVTSKELTAFEAVLFEQMKELEKQKTVAEELHRRVKVAASIVKARIRSDLPDMSNQQAIQAYIKSQNKIKGEQVEATRDLLSKIDLKKLDPRAPIDRAFARKTQRGAQRPTRV